MHLKIPDWLEKFLDIFRRPGHNGNRTVVVIPRCDNNILNDKSTTGTPFLEDNGNTDTIELNNLHHIQFTNLKTNTMSNPLFPSYTLFGKALTWVRAHLIQTNALVNNLKVLEKSPVVQSLEQMLLPLVEGAFPAAHIPAIIALIPQGLKILNLAVGEAAKPDTQVVDDGLAALAKLKTSDHDAYSAILTALHIWLAAKTSVVVGSPIPASIAAENIPAVYSSEKLATSNSSNATDPVHPVYTTWSIPQQLSPADQKTFDTVSVDTQGEKVNTFVNPATVPAV